MIWETVFRPVKSKPHFVRQLYAILDSFPDRCSTYAIEWLSLQRNREVCVGDISIAYVKYRLVFVLQHLDALAKGRLPQIIVGHWKIDDSTSNGNNFIAYGLVVAEQLGYFEENRVSKRPFEHAKYESSPRIENFKPLR